jgi:hypothetical protein
LDADHEVFASLYHAVRWWGDAITAVFHYENNRDKQATTERQRAFFEQTRQSYIALQADLRARIAMIEAGSYPKHPGDHCRYCPVHLDCLGLEP